MDADAQYLRGRLPAFDVPVRSWLVRLARLRRWEFWPMWLFYAPVAAWIAWLALRFRGLSVITAANPGIADGGLVGESKFEILRHLPIEWTIPSFQVPRQRDTGPRRVGASSGSLVDAGMNGDIDSPHGLELSERVDLVLTRARHAGWTFPLVLKPDVGQRGTGVKLVRDRAALADYLARSRDPVLVQPYHPGPYEAGVFYYRTPGERRGRILSITDKHFPVLIGDGHSTIEALVHAHERYRLQASTFLHRHAAVSGRVLRRGERFQLAIAGNHAQGTLFRDGAHLKTPALEARIDAIAQTYPGFFIGRFDIRYGDVEAFKAGRDLAIVELNGATAESTNIYDPESTLLDAYRQLFRQWRLVFLIGAMNRERGASPSSVRRILRLVYAHLISQPAFTISD